MQLLFTISDFIYTQKRKCYHSTPGFSVTGRTPTKLSRKRGRRCASAATYLVHGAPVAPRLGGRLKPGARHGRGLEAGEIGGARALCVARQTDGRTGTREPVSGDGTGR